MARVAQLNALPTWVTTRVGARVPLRRGAARPIEDAAKRSVPRPPRRRRRWASPRASRSRRPGYADHSSASVRPRGIAQPPFETGTLQRGRAGDHVACPSLAALSRRSRSASANRTFCMSVGGATVARPRRTIRAANATPSARRRARSRRVRVSPIDTTHVSPVGAGARRSRPRSRGWREGSPPMAAAGDGVGWLSQG